MFGAAQIVISQDRSVGGNITTCHSYGDHVEMVEPRPPSAEDSLIYFKALICSRPVKSHPRGRIK